MLQHKHARMIAEAQWGSGGTSSYRTNRRGAFYFSCSGHGGFVIDAQALEPNDAYGEPEPYKIAGGKLWWPGRKTALRYRGSVTEGNYFLFEEDCAWCLPVKFGGVKLLDRDWDPEPTWDRWFNPENPELQRDRRMDAERAAGSPDLIIWARADHVGTADGLEHVVTGYKSTNPYLSECASHVQFHA